MVVYVAISILRLVAVMLYPPHTFVHRVIINCIMWQQNSDPKQREENSKCS